ncbi:peptidase inhibitor family I36 protein [Kibdelosporangium philippinense]|uniref:Peptidase inhibitor family I36 protein n=1 Tax=Kibdelosporangium philippinense TaxID=211113 RepID=A0ABS8ZPL1_9PSEU|nr:peptidase inhibitor family I36 protein [Kibdelosporangium philippinense]MCE7009696.1 peptidase inhibitor family I36 protein [Kibdelosporangium philippinense]
MGTAFSASPASAADTVPKCDRGEFCAWPKENYAGNAVRHNLETANPGECVSLGGVVAKSVANRMTKDVTVYQGETCSTEAEFTTYPKGGTFVPDAPFVVKAIQIWE